MKVFVAGATGVLGRGIVRQLVGRGHEVVGLVRDDEGQRVVAALGGVGRRASIFDPDSLARAAEGSEVVVHAATAIPLKARAAARDWEMNDRIRREGTRALAGCAALVGARLYVQQSIVWVATPADGAFFDEDSEARPDEVSRSAFDGERIAFEAAGRGGFRAAVLRCGWFYGPDAGHTRMFGRELMKRRLCPSSAAARRCGRASTRRTRRAPSRPSPRETAKGSGTLWTTRPPGRRKSWKSSRGSWERPRRGARPCGSRGSSRGDRRPVSSRARRTPRTNFSVETSAGSRSIRVTARVSRRSSPRGRPRGS